MGSELFRGPAPALKAMMFQMTDGQFQLVYNVLSFSLASMMATTLFLWMRVPAVGARYQTAVLISGLVTFIAAYHYIRIFNSWVEGYYYPRVLLLGHHLEVWGGAADLPDHEQEVAERAGCPR